ncbi:hypothetical protein [Paenibacillus sp. MMO-58]|uniref:hypothetical protein n=1 Tax=Paenibacillus sp. MMO-58 TaxID=3081290 RepID=UPI0030164835
MEFILWFITISSSVFGLLALSLGIIQSGKKSSSFGEINKEEHNKRSIMGKFKFSGLCAFIVVVTVILLNS